ncbi:MAG: NifB/NifX family molybdenum-iron cluster-binding protein [Hespellia sp.]|nr:NifB/NifX family molybdenum-iron cluster-binding protein [Hespellia sp.]
MPRPSKSKNVSRLPSFDRFAPVGNVSKGCTTIELSVEEYEALRLIDYVGLSQEEGAAQMQVARGTIQTLYTDARRKISRFLVEGTNLQIRGGNYQISYLKGDSKMKIAVTYENGEVFQHFGHSEQFKVYEVEEGKVISSEVVDTNGSGHGALSGFLKAHGVDVLICGGIGGGARTALAEADIELYPGAMGNADAQVESFLKGSLTYDPDTKCAHHDEKHGADHDCGSHSHTCGGHCGH